MTEQTEQPEGRGGSPGRPLGSANNNPWLTEDDVAEALTKGRGVQARAAELLNVTRMAISHHVKGNARLQGIIEDARQARTDKAELNLVDFLESKDDGIRQRATEYVLDTQGKGRGYTKRHEIAPTAPIPVQFDAADADVG